MNKIMEDGPMPWEEDEDLKDLSPEDVLTYAGDDLNFKQKAVLNGLVVKQLQEEKQQNSNRLLDLLEENAKKQKVMISKRL